VSTVPEWLAALGLAQYAEAFAANDIEWDLLPRLTDAILKDIGVKSAGHRLRLLEGITRLSEAGAPERQAAGAPVDGERRQAAVLVADICGYTALCARMDPEQVQALVERFYEASDRIVREYGGYVVDHAGDGTLAAFGAPMAHDNDSERAVRAALNMHRGVSGIVDASGRPIGIHVGIASGEVVAATITSGSQAKYTVTGDPVNLAARLNSAAQDGQTIIAESVWQAVSDVVDARALGAVAVKGLGQPVAMWEVTGLKDPRRQPGALVGRREELGALLDALERVAGRRHGLAICVRGEAGIGKSRLIEEVRERALAHGYACHGVTVLDFGTGRRQDAVAALIKDVLGCSGEDAALSQAVARALFSGAVAADEQVFVNDLLELEQSREQQAVFDAMDNERRTQRLHDTFAAIMERAAARRPTLIVVEDIHWASADVLPYLAALAKAAVRAPLALLMSSRLEGYPLDATWQSSIHGTPLLTLDIGRLTEEQSRELAQRLAHRADTAALECIERAAGNPLFLKQLLRNVEEAHGSSIPASIQSLVLARIDRLRPRDKNGVQAASVLGKRFALGALRELLNDQAFECDGLVQADLLRRDGVDYVFAHALIQEGVYSSLLNSRKRTLHRRAADVSGAQDPLLRCEHLDRAADPEAAAAYLSAAAAQARRFRHESALRLAERGSELAVDNAVRCQLLLLRGDLLRDCGRSSDSLAAFESALEAALNDEQRCRAWMGIVAGYRVTTDIPSAMAALEHAQHIAERLGSPEQRSRIHHVRGNLHFAAGDGAACRREHEAALQHAQSAANAECEAQALSGLGDAEYLRARMLSASEYFRRCVELCEVSGLARVRAANRCMLGHCLYYANRMDEAEAYVVETLQETRRMGLVQIEIFARESLGMLLTWRGDYPRAAQALEAGVPLARNAGARRYLSAMLCGLARCRIAAGEMASAGTLLDEALALTCQTGTAFIGPLISAALAWLEPDAAGAMRLLREGEELLQAGAVSHCHLHFQREAIDVALRWRDGDRARHHVQALEEYVREEPLPWAMLLVERGRTLAAHAAGASDDATLPALRKVKTALEAAGMLSSLPAVEAVLAAR
jgi:class 3 adenylate cyclase/tetratricopeptide (TPR) repeat protein